MGQVIGWDDIEPSLTPKRQSQKIVFTNGCFDLLHVGHIRYLKDAKEQGDLLFIGLNSDQSVKKLKGPSRPIQPENERAEILAALEVVEFVCVFNEDTPFELIQQVKPHVLVKGGDWAVKDIVGSDFVMSYGGEVKSLKFIEGRSTTHLIQKL